MSNEIYGRGEMEWALWRSVASVTAPAEDIQPVFLTRIKRLLELDRSIKFSSEEVPPLVDYVFAAPASEESGEVAYSLIDAFCLAIALDFLDIGFKQSEIVFLMYYLRPDLEEWLPTLVGGPSLTSRQRSSAKHYPEYPSYGGKTRNLADGRVFLIIKKVELKEVSPGLRHRKLKHPVFLEPVYCPGIAELSEKLDALTPYHRRALVVVEIASTAQRVAQNLKLAPEIRRGRPRS